MSAETGMRRVGIMGGTFNPIHHAHLILAERAWQQFDLDTVLFLPNGNPPHKQIAPGDASNHDRLEMVRLAIRNNPHFQLDTEEMMRYGYSYTRDTLCRLKQNEPDTHFFFIIGADSLMSFDQWFHPEEICRYCTLLAGVRNGMTAEEMMRQREYLIRKYQANIEFISIPDLDISSSSLREMHKRGQSIRYFIPDSVYEYIQKSDLYLV